jgi:hypothetical protein
LKEDIKMKQMDASLQRAIHRLKDQGNERVTSILRESAEVVGCYLAELGCGCVDLPRGYKSIVLHGFGGNPRTYLVINGGDSPRTAIIASPKPLWDADGSVLAADTEQIRRFAQDVSSGLIESIAERAAGAYQTRLDEAGKLLGRKPPKKFRRLGDLVGVTVQ